MNDREELILKFQLLERVNMRLLSWNCNPLTQFPNLAGCLAPELALSRLFNPCFLAPNRKGLRAVELPAQNDLVPNPLFKLPTTDQLDRLLYTTIYTKDDAPFSIVDFTLQLEDLVSDSPDDIRTMLRWIDERTLPPAEKVEKHCERVCTETQELRSTSAELEALQRWQKTAHNPTADALALRWMECTVLLLIVRYHLSSLLAQEQLSFSPSTDFGYRELVVRLIDYSESMGLIKAMLGDSQLDDAMVIDQDNMDVLPDFSITGSDEAGLLREFDRYLLSERFRDVKQMHELIELIADRCGIPTGDNDENRPALEKDNRPFASASQQSRSNVVSAANPATIAVPTSPNPRRIKPEPLSKRPITTSKVRLPSSLSQDSALGKRLNPTALRQVDFSLAIGDKKAKNVADRGTRRRGSEAGGSETLRSPRRQEPILQAATPPKKDSSMGARTGIDANHQQLVILETPPKKSSSPAKPDFDKLASTARTLFPPSSFKE